MRCKTGRRLEKVCGGMRRTDDRKGLDLRVEEATMTTAGVYETKIRSTSGTRLDLANGATGRLCVERNEPRGNSSALQRLEQKPAKDQVIGKNRRVEGRTVESRKMREDQIVGQLENLGIDGSEKTARVEKASRS